MSSKRALLRALAACQRSSSSKTQLLTNKSGLSSLSSCTASQFSPLVKNQSISTKDVIHSFKDQQVACYGLAAAKEVAQPSSLPTLSFKISIITSNIRGAGTPTPAYIQLIGTHGESERFLVGDAVDMELTRGSTRIIDVEVPESFGALRLVHVEKIKGSVSDTGDGWFLEQVRSAGISSALPGSAHCPASCCFPG